MTLRQTHTYAELQVSTNTYLEIRQLFEKAGYDHVFMEDGTIDMNGIGLTDGGFTNLIVPSQLRPE